MRLQNHFNQYEALIDCNPGIIRYDRTMVCQALGLMASELTGIESIKSIMPTTVVRDEYREGYVVMTLDRYAESRSYGLTIVHNQTVHAGLSARTESFFDRNWPDLTKHRYASVINSQGKSRETEDEKLLALHADCIDTLFTLGAHRERIEGVLSRREELKKLLGNPNLGPAVLKMVRENLAREVL